MILGRGYRSVFSVLGCVAAFSVPSTVPAGQALPVAVKGASVGYPTHMPDLACRTPSRPHALTPAPLQACLAQGFPLENDTAVTSIPSAWPFTSPKNVPA